MFSWEQLFQNGIGLWYDVRDAAKIKEDNAAKLLDIIGYDVRNDETLKASSYAFCRRFLPEFVRIDKDISCLVDNVLPADYSFMGTEKFLNTLKAVAYNYSIYEEK